MQEVVIEEDLPIVEAKEEEDEVKMEVDEQNNSTPVPFIQSEEGPATPKVHIFSFQMTSHSKVVGDLKLSKDLKLKRFSNLLIHKFV